MHQLSQLDLAFHLVPLVLVHLLRLDCLLLPSLQLPLYFQSRLLHLSNQLDQHFLEGPLDQVVLSLPWLRIGQMDLLDQSRLDCPLLLSDQLLLCFQLVPLAQLRLRLDQVHQSDQLPPYCLQMAPEAQLDLVYQSVQLLPLGLNYLARQLGQHYLVRQLGRHFLEGPLHLLQLPLEHPSDQLHLLAQSLPLGLNYPADQCFLWLLEPPGAPVDQEILALPDLPEGPEHQSRLSFQLLLSVLVHLLNQLNLLLQSRQLLLCCRLDLVFLVIP